MKALKALIIGVQKLCPDAEYSSEKKEDKIDLSNAHNKEETIAKVENGLQEKMIWKTKESEIDSMHVEIKQHGLKLKLY
jgi:hypothetical protein